MPSGTGHHREMNPSSSILVSEPLNFEAQYQPLNAHRRKILEDDKLGKAKIQLSNWTFVDLEIFKLFVSPMSPLKLSPFSSSK